MTGAGSGIGRAVSLDLVRTHRIAVVDRDAAAAAAVVAAAGGVGHAEAYAVDVTEEESLQDAVRRVLQTFGRLDAVAACAGIASGGTVETTTLGDWHRTLAVNLTGVFLTARVTVPHLRATRGSFTAIASDAGTTGAMDMAAYTASKHAVLGLVRGMALDFGRDGVRSNVVCPGFVETPMARGIFADAPEGTEEFYRELIPLGRFAEAEDVAAVVRHLVESRYTNGHAYAIDGGSTAGYYRNPAAPFVAATGGSHGEH
ncbi:SDR family oxidoreductase [Kineococcus rhizosphaerae]|uniref:SDR family NAD(P)-dependent oxidoreductase n=1 Tax=Kineococcus rhizosphaerae TaxID=559628 RepID=UPI002481F54A|nr:SDR family oxidoreductase [Kineococcus rhizosphaerae]